MIFTPKSPKGDFTRLLNLKIFALKLLILETLINENIIILALSRKSRYAGLGVKQR
jgi:hypothetical protein